MINYKMTFYFVIFLTLATDFSLCNKAEEQLLTDLFTYYNRATRPSLHATDKVNVTFGLSLIKIKDVNEKQQFIVVNAWVRQKWKNHFLKWDPLKYDNITDINFDPSMVWRPDIVLYNNAYEDNEFGGNLDRLNTRIKLKYTGDSVWLTPVTLRSKCDIDVKYFPFDTQRCILKFGSWTYDKNQLDLFPESKYVVLENYLKNMEWNLNYALVNRTEKKYFCCSGVFTNITYTISISRRSLFYVYNLIFPLTIIVSLTMLTFLLPAETGERISIAITLLLAMTVFMLLIADIIPATSDVIPLLGVFYIVSMIEMAVMIIVLCYMMHFNHKDSSLAPMSIWMRRFILDWLSYKVGIRIRKKGDKEEEEEATLVMLENHCDENEFTFVNNNGSNTDVVLKKMRQEELTIRFENILRSMFANMDKCIGNRLEIVNNSGDEKVGGLIISKLSYLIDKVKNMEKEDQIKTEWRIVAMTIDRCLLVLFALILVIIIFICFVKTPGYVL